MFAVVEARLIIIIVYWNHIKSLMRQRELRRTDLVAAAAAFVPLMSLLAACQFWALERAIDGVTKSIRQGYKWLGRIAVGSPTGEEEQMT